MGRLILREICVPMRDFMERNREGRRGANGNSAHARRPRTISGFKDASEDESQNSRLQSKKEGFGSRKRRNCRISNGELQQQQQNHYNNNNRSQSEERDESFGEATMPASEEDDDLPPPSIRRRSGKLKIHLKTQEDLNPIDMAVVPRRLRTAMAKRYQDSMAPGQYNENQGKISREVALDVAAPACSTGDLKSARRMKPKNHKVRPENVAKVSSAAISEQEAEVAETLFDLKRMFSIQAANSVSETNSESNLEMKMEANLILSPLSSVKRSSSPVAAAGGSPSSNQTMSALGALKRECPDVSISKDDEAMGAAESADAEQFADRRAVKAEFISSPTRESLALAASIAVSPSTSTNVSLPTPQLPQTLDRPKIEQDISHRLDSGNHASAQKAPSASVVVESIASVARSSDEKSVVAESDIKAVGGPVIKEVTADVEIENGLLHSPLARSDCPGGSEIDLMVPPKCDDLMEPKVDIKDEQELQMNMVTIPEAENPITGMGRFEQREKTTNIQNFGKDNQMLEKIEHGQCNDQKSGKAKEHNKEMPNQSSCLDEAKHEIPKQPSKGSGKNAKAESRVQRGDRSASTTASVAVATSNMTNTALPLSMGIANWHAGIPSLGYYTPAAAAVAAAWPSPLPLTGVSTVDENNKLSPNFFLHSQLSCKRSATHVYITHFIDSQQRLRNNPLWAAAIGANAYNLSIPLPPCVMGVSVGSATGPEVKVAELGATSVNGKGCAMIAMTKDNSCKPYGEGVARNSLPQEQAQTVQQQPSLFSQAGPGFAFPVTQSASASATGSDARGANVGLSEAMLGRGNSNLSIYVAPGDTERDLSNRSVANVAAAQAQTLHSYIQHNSFPYSFAHQQLRPLFGGHPSAQQVAQYYSNPFFGPHIVQPPPLQNSQTPCNLTSETSVSQKQQYAQGYNFASTGSPQQLHNARVSSLEQVAKKEGVTISGIPTAEMKSIGTRVVHGQTSSSMNFPSSLLVGGMPTFPAESQDLSTGFVGKQASKLHYQQQAALNWQQQQQDANVKHTVSSPAIQINPTGADLYTSGPVSLNSTSKNKGSEALSSVMASQGHANLQTAGDSIKGLGQYQSVPAQFLKFSVSEGKQQHQTQTQRLVTVGIEDGKESIEECSYSSSVCKEDKTSHSKHQLNRPNISRVDLEDSPRINACSAPNTASPQMSIVTACSQGAASTSYSVPATVKQLYQSSRQRIVDCMPPSSSNLPSTPAITDSTMVSFSEKTPAHPATFCKMASQHVSSFHGHTLANPIQGVRQGTNLRQQENISQRSSGGLVRPATSDSPIQAAQLNMARTQGQPSSTHNSAANIVPLSRIAVSMSSAGSTPLSSLSPVSKAGAAATPKNAVSLKDSLSPKPSSGSISGKKSTSFQTNGTSVLDSNCLAQNMPVKSSQAQLIQNQYNIHQQNLLYPFFQQTVQSMESVQQQQLLPTQQYQLPSKQQQAVQLQKQSLAQQPQLQFRQHLFMQPNSQYLHTQAHQHSEIPSQAQAIVHSQNATKQMKNISGQITSSSQQLINLQQQQILAAPPASFGAATNATLPDTLCLGASGNSPRKVISDGVLAPLTTSSFRKGNSTGPTFLTSQCGPSNSAPSTQQQVSNSCTISSPYPNLLSQPTSFTDTTQKIVEDKPGKGN